MITVFVLFVYLISTYFLVFWYLSLLDKDIEESVPGWKTLKNLPEVTVVIPAYNEEKEISSTINSVLNLNYPEDKIYLIVANDGSKDNTSNVVKEIINQNPDRNIRLIQQENSGKASALNRAIQEVNTEFFVCLDADSEVHPDTLKKMIHKLKTSEENTQDRKNKENNETVAIVTPAMKVKNPKSLVQDMQYIEYLLSLLQARIMSKNDAVYVAPGPFSLYRTNIIKSLGGFDENNLTEDQEIAYRVKKHGFKIVNCPDAFVYTSSPESFKKLGKQRNRWYKGGLMNAWKYRSMMFKKEYGHFGYFQLPLNFMTYFLALSAIIFFCYYSLKPIFNQIKNLFLVGFDLKPLFSNFSFQINLLNINFLLSIFLFFSIFVITVLLLRVFKEYGEKISFKRIISLLSFYFIYPLFLGSIVVIVFVQLLFGKIQKW